MSISDWTIDNIMANIHDDVENGEFLEIFVDDRPIRRMNAIVYYTSAVGWYIIIKGRRFALTNTGKGFRLMLRKEHSYD